MAADINDKITDVYNGQWPEVTRVSNARSAAGTTLETENLQGWPVASSVHFTTFRLDSQGEVDYDSQIDWKGIRSGNNIISLTRVTGAADAGSFVGDYVKMLPTVGWAQDLVAALLTNQERSGALKKVPVEDALQLKTTEIIADHIVPSTGIVAVSAGLTCTISSITGYMSGIRYTKASIPNKTFTASKDTYCFIELANGTITYTEVANYAQAPSAPAGSILFAVVPTDATTIVGISLRNRRASKSDTEWVELGRHTLTSAGDFLRVAGFEQKRYLRYHIISKASGTVNAFIRFNNDSGNNYSQRYITDNTTAGVSTSVSNAASVAPGGADVDINGNISNDPSRVKFGDALIIYGSAPVANAPAVIRVESKWGNTSVAISRLDFINTGAGDFAAGSELIIEGKD
ncbi:hypothetical protein I8H89_00290 [Candidatus Saccharibacteria bacterium]|nr:hypothetical protein [Candidatus Saccharibacteria bacterium]